MKPRTVQIVLIAASILLVVALVFSPRLISEDRLKVEKTPTNAKIEEAVALVQNGENPMQGIGMLREILAEDSTNVDVHWHLAQFSLTSRQIENAVFRFQKVLQYDSKQKYPEAYFWLGQSYIALEENTKAIPLLEKYLTFQGDTAVTMRVEQMLMQLKADTL